VVMYYLNSGIARFEGLTEFDPMFSASSTRSTKTKTKPKQTLAAPNLPGVRYFMSFLRCSIIYTVTRMSCREYNLNKKQHAIEFVLEGFELFTYS
jgi:hypothetical protein